MLYRKWVIIMNNNMPNNFNNGMSNNMNDNNNLMAREANEELIGGQSNIGNGPDVMQGVSNVQNDRGIMQGFNNVQNPNGVMQGMESVAQDMNNSVPMPGQFNAGVNNYTMQVERPQENPVPNEPIMPNVEPQMPNSDMNIPNFNNSQPMNINAEGIPTNNQTMPQMSINNNIFEGLRDDNQAKEPINNLNQGLDTINDFNRPVVDVGVPSGAEFSTQVNEQPEMPLPQNENVLTEPINGAPQETSQSFNVNPSIDLNTPNIDAPTVGISNESENPSIPNIDISNINEENINNEVTNANIQNSIDNTSKIPNPFAMNNANLQANLNGQMNNEANIPQTNIMGTPINMEQSSEINQMTMEEPVVSPIMDQPQVSDNVSINNQIGNTQDLNSFVGTPQQPEFNNNVEKPIPQMNNNNYQSVDMPQEKVKKFPLSLRETILVTIALIGIVAVVIMYWPN